MNAPAPNFWGAYGGVSKRKPYPHYSVTDARNFLANFRIGRPDECWRWRTKLWPSGYGIFSCWNRNMRAHRAAWIFYRSPIPDGMEVLHTCDNPACINPRHLFLGNTAINVADKIAKGRQPRGEQCTHAKLTAAQVAEIRARYKAGGVSCRQLSKVYGVSDSAINDAVRGKTWGYEPESTKAA